MSKTISSGLAQHLAGEVTTLATCWKVTRRDGVVLGFTDHVRDLKVDGVSYKADLAVDNLDVESVFSDDGITEEDLRTGRYDFAEVRMFLVNYENLAQGILKLRRGWLGEVTIRDGMYVAELRGMTQRLASRRRLPVAGRRLPREPLCLHWKGWLARLKVQPAEIVAAAREWLGTPWCHQGRLKGVAVDCGGLIIGVGKETGLLDFDTRAYGRIPNGQHARRTARPHGIGEQAAVHHGERKRSGCDGHHGRGHPGRPDRRPAPAALRRRHEGRGGRACLREHRWQRGWWRLPSLQELRS